MGRRSLAAMILIVGIASAGAVALLSPFKALAIIIAAMALFAAGSLLSAAGQFSQRLRDFVGKTVNMKVWDNELPGRAGCQYEVVSVRGLGAGLLIHLRPLPGGNGILLKVAQPEALTVEVGKAEIANAAYVQWAGSKIKKPTDGIAPALSMRVID